MKLHKNKQNNMIAGVVTACLLLIAVMVTVNVTSNRGEIPVEDGHQTTATGTAESSTVATSDSTDSEAVTTQPPVTQSQSPQTRQSGNSNTEPSVIEITLAPVEVPNRRIREIIEQNDVQVAPPATQVRTSPPPSEQRSPTATTYIDGQKYTWDPVIGWIRSSGDGQVIIMDVEDDGRRYDGGW